MNSSPKLSLLPIEVSGAREGVIVGITHPLVVERSHPKALRAYAELSFAASFL